MKNSKKLLSGDPLIQNGQQLVPNVTRVFRPGQSMFVYVEVYDPSIPDSLPENFRRPDVEASTAIYRAKKKVLETPPIRTTTLDARRQATLPVWMQLPVDKIPPGKYECQVNLIDQFGRKFAFPRLSFAVVGSTYLSGLIP